MADSKVPAKTGVPKSLIDSYSDCKSKVHISGDESRVELMGKVLEMDEEISLLLKELRCKETELRRMKSTLKEVKDDSQRKEDGLMDELEMLTNKNSVMSNLYDIVTDHAEAVEEELEKRLSMICDVTDDSSPTNSPA